MTDRRDVPQPVELRRNLWCWSATIPWLPDILADADHASLTGDVLGELDAGYRSLMEALATSTAVGSALQIRVTSVPPQAGTGVVLRVALHGRARSATDALRLAQLVTATLPPLIPLEPVEPTRVAASLRLLPVDDVPVEGLAEIRRRIEALDPTVEPRAGHMPLSPAVLAWRPVPHALRGALAGLRTQPGRVVLCLHAEPSAPTLELMDHLDATARDVLGAMDGNPMAAEIITTYRHRLRELPRAAVALRVLVAADQHLPAGVPEAIGIDLAGSSFAVVRPHDAQELALAIDLLETFTPHHWQVPERPEMAEMLFLSDPTEAATVFRFPIAPRGGLAGLPSARISTLPRSPQARNTAPEPAVRLGAAVGGGVVDLTLTEINQHLLVAGLPGFGKTTTVQTILHRLAADHGIPFLVIDPAKSDYANLIGELHDKPGAATGARRIVLDAATPAFNPFATPTGCSPTVHAGRILAAFDAALGLSGVWPTGYITLGRSLFAAYERCDDGDAPTLRSLYATLGDIIRRSGFTGPDGLNARAALLGRIEFLVRGPLGAALTGGPRAGVDWPDLTSRATVIELRRFAGPTERSLVFALLLAGLVSYREAHPTAGELAHVTVLEEAHRVLAPNDGAGAEGLRLMVEAVAELRGSGEGFVIIDQAPSTLHPGIPKVTGSVLTHRLAEPAEREVIGASLLLDARQQHDLARLPRGRAVLYGGQTGGSVVVEVDSIVGPARSGTVTAATSAALSPSVPDPMICIGCRTTCRHEATGRELAEHHELAAHSGRSLVSAALALTANHEGRTRCVVAHVLGTRLRDAEPRALLSELTRLDDALQSRTPAASAPSGERETP